MDKTIDTPDGSLKNDRFSKPRYARLVPIFITDLYSASSELRRNAAQALGRLGDARAVPPLLAKVQNPDEMPAVRKAVAKALGRLGDARAISVLNQALTTEVDISVQKTLKKAIERLQQSQLSLAPDLSDRPTKKLM